MVLFVVGGPVFAAAVVLDTAAKVGATIATIEAAGAGAVIGAAGAAGGGAVTGATIGVAAASGGVGGGRSGCHIGWWVNRGVSGFGRLRRRWVQLGLLEAP
jgi:hypothetical protein